MSQTDNQQPRDSGRFASHSPEDVIREIQSVAERMGRPPSSNEFNRESNIHYSTVRRKFGSWEAGLKISGVGARSEAGENKHTPQKGPTRKLSKQELLADLTEFGSKIGHTPTYKEMDCRGPHAAKTYVRRFDSWNDAVQQVGLERNKTPRVDGRGIEWQRAAERARSRDQERCQFCGMDNLAHKAVFGASLHVHHVEKLSEFDDYSEAHRLGNLLTLCSRCHLRFEQ